MTSGTVLGNQEAPGRCVPGGGGACFHVLPTGGPTSLSSHFGSLISLENLSVGLCFLDFFSMLLRTMGTKG